MSKKLLGSLTVASAAPTPQELPPAARLAALIDRAAKGADHHTTASILRSKLGSYVQPVSGVGFVAKTMLRQGENFVLNGHTLAGKRAQMVVKDAVQDFVPRWARRLAAVAVFAWGGQFGPIVNEFITNAGLPIDPSVDWDARLNNIFMSTGVKNDEERKDAIQDAILTVFMVRHMLDRFDPERGESADGVETPLENRLTAYLTKAFKWVATEDAGAGDKARQRQFEQGFTIDEPLGDETGGPTLADLTPGDYVDQEAQAHSESVIRSIDEFLTAFEKHLQETRGGNLSKTCITLLKIVMSAHDAAEVKARWPIETGTSYSNMRRILPIVAEELLRFSETSKAPNVPLTQLLNKLRQRLIEQGGAPEEEPEAVPAAPEPEPSTEEVGAKARRQEETPKTSSVTICASAEDFMTKLAAYVHELRKEAAPKVIEQSILYLRLGGNKTNPRFMDISFYSPKLRTLPGAGGYKIEVGDWGQDRSLPERRIRQAVGTFVIPMMRGDVLEEDHDLLEKVIRRLRSIVWENAVEYFQIPFDQKPAWRNTIKMDIAQLLDTKVTIQDPDRGAVEVAASLTEGALGRKAARKLAGGYLPVEDDTAEGHPVVAHEVCGAKRQIAVNAACDECEAPGAAWEPVLPKPKWNEEKQQWDPGDKTPGGLLGGQPARYGSKRAKAAAFMSREELESLGKEAAGGYHKQHPDMKWPQAQIGDTAQWGGGFWGRQTGTVVGLRKKEHKLVVQPSNPNEAPVVLGMDRIDAIIPKQARSLGGERNLTPAEQTDFAPDPDHMTTASQEAPVSNQKFAALKRIAAENPEAIAEAIDGLKSQLSEQLNNLTILQENLGIKEPVGEVKEGEPVEVKDVEGEEKFAGLKHLAAEEPAQLEEAFGEFYLAMDNIMAQTEALADNLDITLPDAAPVDVETEAAEEGESVPAEVAEGGADTDDGLHGEQPAATEEHATVE